MLNVNLDLYLINLLALKYQIAKNQMDLKQLLALNVWIISILKQAPKSAYHLILQFNTVGVILMTHNNANNVIFLSFLLSKLAILVQQEMIIVKHTMILRIHAPFAKQNLHLLQLEVSLLMMIIQIKKVFVIQYKLIVATLTCKINQSVSNVLKTQIFLKDG